MKNFTKFSDDDHYLFILITSIMKRAFSFYCYSCYYLYLLSFWIMNGDVICSGTSLFKNDNEVTNKQTIYNDDDTIVQVRKCFFGLFSLLFLYATKVEYLISDNDVWKLLYMKNEKWWWDIEIRQVWLVLINRIDDWLPSSMMMMMIGLDFVALLIENGFSLFLKKLFFSLFYFDFDLKKLLCLFLFICNKLLWLKSSVQFWEKVNKFHITCLMCWFSMSIFFQFSNICLFVLCSLVVF